jgi:hypothetical protein
MPDVQAEVERRSSRRRKKAASDWLGGLSGECRACKSGHHEGVSEFPAKGSHAG